MLNNQDFKGFPNFLMFITVFSAYEAIYNFSKFINLRWVDTSLGVRSPHYPPSVDSGVFDIIFMFITFIPALIISIKRFLTRTKNKKTQVKYEFYNYCKHIFLFVLLLIFLLIFIPIINPYMRGWR